MNETVLSYVRKHALLGAGERVAVAVSGGADSVALLRVLLELRRELGVVLSVAHFNHRIRGAASDADEKFVAELAEKFGLPLHRGSADVPALARERGVSLETAAREARYRFLHGLTPATVDKVATAHTADDQAETVLMRLLRGAGTRGLAGIYPALQDPAGRVTIVRPLLELRRRDIEAYLLALGQDWREDETNRDLAHRRNRVRHELLPQLERDYNPVLPRVLGEMAETARAEEEFWRAEIARLLPLVETSKAGGRSRPTRASAETFAFSRDALLRQPLAVQRRLVRAATDRLGFALDFEHVQRLLDSLSGGVHAIELPGGWIGRASARELVLTRASVPPAAYEYPLSVPGEAHVPALGSVVRAVLVTGQTGTDAYNREQSLDPQAVGKSLVVRSWRPGDRYWPAHTRSPKKVKELLEAKRAGDTGSRKLWPVVSDGERIVWMRGFSAPAELQAKPGAAAALVIEEIAQQESNPNRGG